MKKNNWEPSAQLGVSCTTVQAAGYFAMAQLAPSAPLHCVFFQKIIAEIRKLTARTPYR